MDIKEKKVEEDNDKKGVLVSLTFHTLLGILLFLPMGHAIKSIENTQIQVELPKDLLGGGPALGLPNQGSGSNPAPGKPDPNAGNTASKPTPAPPTPAPPVKAPPKPVFSAKPTPAAPPKKVETTEDPNAAVIRRQQEAARQKAEEAKYQAEATARAKRQAEDAAKAEQAKKASDAAAAQAAKDKFKGRFGTGTGGGTNGGGGTGTGQGNTGKPGNQGQPDGDPNSKVLEGMGRGAGTINGFGGRGVRSAPKLQESSQKQGRVVLSVCVDASGNVTSADFKAVGSTTTDDDLIEAAKRNARQYRFAPGSVDKQCGTITYNFIVK